ncbi:CLUMA_CG020511, isoform A, partial [Clunio marinus]
MHIVKNWVSKIGLFWNANRNHSRWSLHLDFELTIKFLSTVFIANLFRAKLIELNV